MHYSQFLHHVSLYGQSMKNRTPQTQMNLNQMAVRVKYISVNNLYSVISTITKTDTSNLSKHRGDVNRKTKKSFFSERFGRRQAARGRPGVRVDPFITFIGRFLIRPT